MKKFLTAFLLCGAVTPWCVKQTSAEEPALQPPAKPPTIYSFIKVRNVTPRLMVWWLDPQHNPEPPEYENAHLAAAQNYAPANKNLASAIQTNRQGTKRSDFFNLPEGIASIVAVDPQNALLAMGTPDSIRNLETLVTSLDRPLRQVEIEAQFAIVESKYVKALGIEMPGKPSDFHVTPTVIHDSPASLSAATSLEVADNMTFGFVRNNFRATMKALEAKGLAKTVATPRIIAINNLEAVCYIQTSDPTVAKASEDGMFPETKLFIGRRRGLVATPTVNTDDTVTLVLTPFLARGVMQPEVANLAEPDPATWVLIPQATTSANSIVNIKDGDTIALRDLTLPNVSPQSGNALQLNKAPAEMVLFVTVHIIHTVEDKVPGT